MITVFYEIHHGFHVKLDAEMLYVIIDIYHTACGEVMVIAVMKLMDYQAYINR